jgi:hypothetical protein
MLRRCELCNQDRPIHEFARARGEKYGWCTPCYLERRREGYARAVAYLTDQDLAAGRDPAANRAIWTYSDPEGTLRDAGRRRRAREQAAVKDGYRRRDIFGRDGWQCQICQAELDEDTATIDHIVPLALGGSDTSENVRTACRSCNSRRGSRVGLADY